MKSKAKISLAAALALTLTFCGCGDVLAPTKQDKKIVMTIGDEEVEYQEYRYFFLNNKREQYGDDAELTAEQVAELQQMAAENIKNRHTLRIMASGYQVTLTDEEKAGVDGYVDSYRSGFEDDAEYAEMLGEQFITDDLFRSITADTVLARAVLEKMKETGVIETGEEAENRALAGDDIICIKEIYLYNPSAETAESVRKRAEEALARLDAGESFEAMMEQYSSYNADELPYEYGYYTAKYDALDVIWDAAEQLDVGEYSGIVESEYGCHIVMRCEKNAGYMNEHRDEIFEIYTQSKFYEEFYRLYDSLTPEFTEYGAKLDFAGMK